MKGKYIYDNDYIEGVEGEETITYKDFEFNGLFFKVLITKCKESNEESYYNLYIINNIFKIEPMNNLIEQIPIESVKDEKEYFNLKFLEKEAIKFYLWYKYGNPSENEVISFDITEYNNQ